MSILKTMYIGKRIKIHILLPLLFTTAYFGKYIELYAISWGFALVHECAHIYVLNKFEIPVSEIILQPFGVCAKIKTPVIKNPIHEIFMALAGPFVNLILGLIFAVMYRYYSSELTRYCVAANFAIFFINLLPCLPLDGGRIIKAILTLGSDALTALKITIKISRIIILILLAIGILLLLVSKFNFSMIMIGVFLMGNICFEQKSISVQYLRELLYYRDKPNKRQFSNVCVITAYESMPARKILRRLSYHKYYVVHVLDNNKKIIRTLTEGQILSALLNDSIMIPLGKIK